MLAVVAGIGRPSIDQVTRGVVPLAIAEFCLLFLMVAFPWLVSWPARFWSG